MVDQRMAAIALQKSNSGETPSAPELAALKRVEKAREETMRWAYYRSVPQRHWIDMSGRQAKVLQEQAERYGLPIGGASIDLPAVVKALHDLLATNASVLVRAVANAQEGGTAGADPANAETLKTLAESTDPISISKAAMIMAARRIADAGSRGLISGVEFDNLKKALQELRQAEADYITLRQSKEELIERDTVKLIVGTCCARLVQCLANVENSIAGELQVWLADPATAAMQADERARKVRDFVSNTCNEVRRQEAATLEAHLDQAKAEEGA